MKLILKIIKIFPPESSHKIALFLLKILYKLKILNFLFPAGNQNNFEYLNLSFKNRLGTAAGLDKNGDYIDALGELGFGFLEVGTVTPLAQSGNPKPRVFRNYKENSIINRLGFNNKGVDYLVNNLKRRNYKGILGVNIGANKHSIGDQRINDYLVCLEKVNKYADYITINISSPNTPNLRDLHNRENLTLLIDAIDKSIKDLNIIKPIFLKISPDESDKTIINIITHIENSSLSGIIATNTTIDKSMLVNEKIKSIDGGLSGEPIMNKSTQRLSFIKSKSKDLPLIGVGGVLSKEDFNEKINAGASLVQIYTGFILKGPNLITEVLNN